MRVLQLVTTRRPFFEQQVESLERQGVDVTTVTVPGGGSGRRSPIAYARFYAEVLQTVREGDYDVVHANYGLVGPAALAQPVRPIVLSVWGSDLMGPDWLARLTTETAHRCDAVVSPSKPISNRLDCSHRQIPFGVDTERFRPLSQERVRRAIDWQSDDPIVLFPYPKSRAVKNYPLAQEVVDELRQSVDLRTLSGVPHETVPLYMNASDAVLVTSDRESGPMVVKEAAACNVPVVSTNVGFTESVLEDVDGSYVCDSKDELVDALSTVIHEDTRSNGRSQVDGLNVDKLGENLADLYADVR